MEAIDSPAAELAILYYPTTAGVAVLAKGKRLAHLHGIQSGSQTAHTDGLLPSVGVTVSLSSGDERALFLPHENANGERRVRLFNTSLLRLS